ncbi:hypothetical protein [Consotaella aegiceratis]|uniref:hypothetical protein n=1 Tax=Consotaella aegiceratis TaxID=3097961 RepID=UPI002F4188B9
MGKKRDSVSAQKGRPTETIAPDYGRIFSKLLREMRIERGLTVNSLDAVMGRRLTISQFGGCPSE